MPLWQVCSVGNQWVDSDDATSASLEQAFTGTANRVVQVVGVHPVTMNRVSDAFDVWSMTWGCSRVRRSVRELSSTRFGYWNDDSWEWYDPFAQSTIATALSAGREWICLHTDSAIYDISLQPGNYMQANRSTGRLRPVRVEGSPVVQHVEDDSAVEDGTAEVEISDDPSMPAEFRCPITQMPMNKPVVLSDGHSYEYRAIQKWLLKKQSSPVTGKLFSSTALIANHNLRKLIQDWASTTSAKKQRLG